jgi:hypothetical protein
MVALAFTATPPIKEELSPRIGYVMAVIRLSDNQILYCGLSEGRVAFCSKPGTHFVWGRNEEEVQERARHDSAYFRRQERSALCGANP